MAYQPGNLAPDLIREMLQGIVENEKSFADLVCGTQFRQVTQMQGSVNVRDSAATLGIVDGYLGLAPAEESPGEEFGVTSVTYHAKPRVGKTVITDEERNDFDAAFGEDLVNDRMAQAYRSANTKLDKYLETKLSSTSLNEEFAAGSDGGGTWTGATSTMADDLRTCRETFAPGADTIIIGRALRNVMLDNDGLLASPVAGNYYGGGTGEASILEAWLKQYIGFKNVYFFDKMYNTGNARGGTPAVGYLFDALAWVGYADDLVLVHPSHAINDIAETERIVAKRTDLVQVARYDDILRPTLLKGSVITGATA